MNIVPREFFIDPFENDWEMIAPNDFKCDIYEKDGKYHFEMDVAGVEKEDISLEFDKGYLTVSISKKESKNDEGKNYIRRERYSKSYTRQFYVGDINPSEIRAEFKNGLFKITTPKEEQKSSRKMIDIK